jgi:hypothetical protein
LPQLEFHRYQFEEEGKNCFFDVVVAQGELADFPREKLGGLKPVFEFGYEKMHCLICHRTIAHLRVSYSPNWKRWQTLEEMAHLKRDQAGGQVLIWDVKLGALDVKQKAHGSAALGKRWKSAQPGAEEDEAIVRHLASGMQPWSSQQAASYGMSEDVTRIDVVRSLVLQRLQRVRKYFPAASESELSEAMAMYSPESLLFAKGHPSAEVVPEDSWEKFQGELTYGSANNYHAGVNAVFGDEIPDSKKMQSVLEEMLKGGNANDRYNLWYVLFCPAQEQDAYDEHGKVRPGKTAGTKKVLDQGHGGMRLVDFTRNLNARLAKCKRTQVHEVHVLAVRLYTASSFRQFNNALRHKGSGMNGGADLKFRACIQSAHDCLFRMQAIPREDKERTSTYRGITGYLGADTKHDGMGMDFAFFSTSANEEVAAEFLHGANKSVLFVVEYDPGCPGADVSAISIYPGEKEVLFPPCSGLSFKAMVSPATGMERVVVTVRAAHRD